ncbi:probable methyltransferase At1g29790 [Zingiber officinale]|nr:probable methyltransferase At1g29790 [Zingiber officinale]
MRWRMETRHIPRSSFTRAIVILQIILVVFVILSVASLHHFFHVGYFLDANEENCQKFQTMSNGYADYDLTALHDRVEEALARISDIQNKLQSSLKNKRSIAVKNITHTELRIFLEEQVMQPLYSVHVALTLVRIPKPDAVEAPLINFFTVEETRKYITGKGNKDGKLSVYGTNRTYNTIGHACVLMRKELEEYMDYDMGSYCKDDWNLAQKLMLGGCDPLPRRRCLAPASNLYQKPLPINMSLWTMPDDRNVRWSNYKCRDFKCLSSRSPRRSFSKCIGCFEFEKEKLRWVSNVSLADFLIADVLAVKPGEIRIGLDVSVGTGSFAARMREWNVTIVSTSLNLGAPFSETIALRGLIPLYVTLNQRLPFFDNTMDLIHSSVFLDGWIDLQLLDFILFDWDRVLRPGGLLWLDKFFCSRKDLDDYIYMFLQFRYKKHKWVISFKSKDEVYLSALLEKPPRSL